MAFFDDRGVCLVDIVVDKRTRCLKTSGDGWLFIKGKKAFEIANFLGVPVADVLAADDIKEVAAKKDVDTGRKRKNGNTDSGKADKR